MPKDIKKVILICLDTAESPQLLEGAKSETLPSLGKLAREGTVIPEIISPSGHAALASIATGASHATHSVSTSGDESKAEYLWESWQRSSKRSVLFSYPADRIPDRQATDVGDAKSVANYLLINPDWDLCFVLLGSNGLKVDGVRALDEAIGAISGVADDETLTVLVSLSSEGAGGFIILKGSGVRQRAVLKRIVRLEDIAPTISYLAEASVPLDCEGGIIYQALEDPDMKIKELRAARRNYERLKRSTGPTVMC